MLATIVTRIRQPSGGIPLVAAYDYNEKIWNPPMPLLFQWQWRLEDRPSARTVIRHLINDTLASTGLTDASGAPLRVTPHDFRRLFISDAVMHGMPPTSPSLSQVTVTSTSQWDTRPSTPKKSSTATGRLSPAAVQLRPCEEYRMPTDEEWEEFLGHFQRRRVALGECGRSYSSLCIHEHSCLRCPFCGRRRTNGHGSPRSATTCSTGSPRPNAKDGTAKSTDSGSAWRRGNQTRPDSIRWPAGPATIQLEYPPSAKSLAAPPLQTPRSGTMRTQPDDLEPPGEPITIAYPIDSLVHLAELLGEIDEFLRSGTDVTDLLAVFMIRRGPPTPASGSYNLIDDLSFTAHHIRCLVDDVGCQRS